MKAEKFLQEDYENRIKFILNGKTLYYTKEELRAFFNDLFRKNGDYCDHDEFANIIAKLKKYDGDFYGDCTDDEYRRLLNESLALGALPQSGVTFRPKP